jgi:hypothetical protein
MQHIPLEIVYLGIIRGTPAQCCCNAVLRRLMTAASDARSVKRLKAKDFDSDVEGSSLGADAVGQSPKR